MAVLHAEPDHRAGHQYPARRSGFRHAEDIAGLDRLPAGTSLRSGADVPAERAHRSCAARRRHDRRARPVGRWAHTQPLCVQLQGNPEYVRHRQPDRGEAGDRADQAHRAGWPRLLPAGDEYRLLRWVGTAARFDQPVIGVAFPTSALSLAAANRQTLGQLGLYVQDQLALGGWRLTVGGRQDFSELSQFNELSNTTTNSTPDRFTGRAGLLYLFDSGVAPYVNYATSFLPQAGTTAPGRGASPFAPTTGESIEAGIKYQPRGWNSYFTATWFNLTKDNVLTVDPVFGAMYSVQTGQIRSRGTELEAVLSLAEGLKGIASYSYTEAEVTRSNDADLGKVPIGVPTQQAAVFLDYTWQTGALAGFGLGAGVRWIDQTWADSANTVRNPASTAFDAGVHYDVRGMRFAVNARNLGDQRVGICNGGNCTFTQGRTVLGSVTARW
ncbi:TonB-dependent siderophore receptor [Rhodopseudomonas palustris]|uniref:TonB-dependent receptor n=1 Tax=Rhodopseudomonas palustris (strain ATCC BAA-98 / CGA009) TaxID=258594 RepID=A0AAE9XYU0_RHOPA|nr:TonB-dependent receptor [Rhodopseudomonas palustris]OPF89935.1 hypothetical protein B1S06_21180 [Rhodopseudomonas palustris]WAB75760.1 TonB-dependent receptor [Rhodopseudomonas palustris]WCL93009.1 TonB-dependent receptor [Rhodopseudomonas palustris CGA009]WND49670.1 TonB-dependent receptor [Rhodopseudomonas palustris]